MSRKHFEALAAALRSNAPSPDSSSFEIEAELFERVVDAVAGACERANPRFDRERFETASGLAVIQIAARFTIQIAEQQRSTTSSFVRAQSQ